MATPPQSVNTFSPSFDPSDLVGLDSEVHREQFLTPAVPRLSGAWRDFFGTGATCGWVPVSLLTRGCRVPVQDLCRLFLSFDEVESYPLLFDPRRPDEGSSAVRRAA